MLSRGTRIILAVLTVVSVGSLGRMLYVEREKQQLSSAYKEAQQMVQQLTQDRQQLTTDLASAKDTIQQQAGENASLQQQLQTVQGDLAKKTQQVATLQREQQQMKQQNAKLAADLNTATTEKQQLEARLSSLKELRLAIRDVKRQMWQQRLASWRARGDRFREADRERLAKGNRGFIVRDGQTTLGSTPRLHVHVLEPQAE